MDNIKPIKIAKIFDSNKPYRKPDSMIIDLSMTYIDVAILIHESKIEDWRSPFIVNAALAIELYLKSMLSTKKTYGPFYLSEKKVYLDQSKSEIDKTNKKHSLSALFESLPERNKDYILHIFDCQAKDVDFIQFLEYYNNAFVQWRYCFEGNAKTFSVEKILKVLKVLKGNRNSLSMLDREIPHYEG